MAIVEVYTFSTLLHVKTPFGRSAQKTVTLPPPCFVRTCKTGCADDTVALEPPKNMDALTTAALPAVRLHLPMLADPHRPRTTFHTTLLRPPPPTPCLPMRTPQMLMTLRTRGRTRSMFARLIPLGHYSTLHAGPSFSFLTPTTVPKQVHTNTLFSSPSSNTPLITPQPFLLVSQTPTFPPPQTRNECSSPDQPKYFFEEILVEG